jgi:hypothetical protein
LCLGAGEPLGVVGVAPPLPGLGEAASVIAADKARTIATPATIATRIGLAPVSRDEKEGPLDWVINLVSTVHEAGRGEARRPSLCDLHPDCVLRAAH